MTIGNFDEKVGSNKRDKIQTKGSLNAYYGLKGGDKFLVRKGKARGDVPVNILLGGQDDDVYKTSKNNFTLVYDTGGKKDTFISNVPVLGPNIRYADIEGNLYAFDPTETSAAIFINWQRNKFGIERIKAPDGVFPREFFQANLEFSPNFLGSFTWNQAADVFDFDFDRLGLKAGKVNRAIKQIRKREKELIRQESRASADGVLQQANSDTSDRLESNKKPIRSIGKFENFIGSNENDRFKVKENLKLYYGLDGDDRFKVREGKLPDAQQVNILAGGNGDDTYKLQPNSTNIILDSKGNDMLITKSPALSPDTFYAEIDGKHIYSFNRDFGGVLVLNWRRKGGIETIKTKDGTFTLQFFKDSITDAATYLGNYSWKAAAREFAFDLKGLGLKPGNVNKAITQVVNQEKKLRKEVSTDELLGGERDGLLVGGKNDDTLMGGNGNNILKGLAGDDHLLGGGGKNLAIGGPGNDLFALTVGGLMTISDWDMGDRLVTMGSLSPDDISTVYRSGDTLIQAEGHTLAVLAGVQVHNLTITDGTGLF